MQSRPYKRQLNVRSGDLVVGREKGDDTHAKETGARIRAVDSEIPILLPGAVGSYGSEVESAESVTGRGKSWSVDSLLFEVDMQKVKAGGGANLCAMVIWV